jgi:hypothetical protein
MKKEPKPKKCAICPCDFIPRNIGQKVCSFVCSIKYATIKQAQKEKKAGLDQMKTLSDYLKTAQKIFNTFIRMRDANDPCISCQKSLRNGNVDAGHFYPTTKSFLRFNEDNVHAQCSRPCNKDLHANLHEYRVYLIKKIGLERVEWLDNNRNEKSNYTIDSLKELIKEYRLKIKLLKIDKSIDY